MKTATVTKPFDGCPDGSAIVRKFKVGDAVEGDLAQVAIDEKWAEEFDPDASDKPKTLKQMSKGELVDFAEANEIDLGDAKLKEDILAAVELAQEGAGS